MRSDPEISIFRRFDYLHLRELLHLQEELTLLEEKLHEVDRAEPKEINNMSRRHDTNEERRNLMFQIRARLLEYGAVAPLSLRYYPCFPMGLIFSKKDQLLINYERIVNFNVPMKRNIRHFRRWLDNMNPVIAEESTVYHNERDLCTTNTYVSDYSLLETIFHWLAGRVIGIRGFSWVTHTTSYDRGLVVCADNCDVLDFPDRSMYFIPRQLPQRVC